MDQPANKQAPQSQDAAVRHSLESIYKTSPGNPGADISYLDVVRPPRWKIWLLGLLGLAAVVGGLVWLVAGLINQSDGGTSTSVKLGFTGPVEITSGDEVTYELKYTNIDRVAVGKLELIIRYPDGFTYTSASVEPVNEFHTVWELSDLAPGQTGTLSIKGKLVGEVGSAKAINATLAYQPQNFSSLFRETGSFSSTVTSSLLSVAVAGPDQTLPEKKVTYTVTYRNSSDHPLTGVAVQLRYPESFVVQQADPAPLTVADGRNLPAQWVFDRLEPRQEGQIVLEGGFVKPASADQQSEDQDQKLEAQIGFLDEAQAFSLQQSQSLVTKLVQPGLSLQLIMNGSATSQPVSFGQTLTYTLAYKNLGAHDLDDVRLNVSIESDAVDWAGLEDKNGGKVSGHTITWTKDQISGLDVLRPLDQGEITFSLPVKDVPADQAPALSTLRSQASASVAAVGELVSPDLVVQSNTVEGTLTTELQFHVEGRYFSDDNIAVGTGPLPPVVGQTTSFRVYWSIANSLHEVTNVSVTSELPAGVDWAAKQLASAGTVSYDAKTRKVSWAVGRIPPGTSAEQANVWFDVSVTPTKDQARKLLILTDQANLTATDKETGSQVVKVGKIVTSNLEDDPVGSGKGIVVDITE